MRSVKEKFCVCCLQHDSMLTVITAATPGAHPLGQYPSFGVKCQCGVHFKHSSAACFFSLRRLKYESKKTQKTVSNIHCNTVHSSTRQLNFFNSIHCESEDIKTLRLVQSLSTKKTKQNKGNPMRISTMLEF